MQRDMVEPSFGRKCGAGQVGNRGVRAVGKDGGKGTEHGRDWDISEDCMVSKEARMEDGCRSGGEQASAAVHYVREDALKTNQDPGTLPLPREKILWSAS